VNAFQPWVNAEWAGALLGQMRWPGDPDHVDTLTEAMERPIDHDVIKGTRVRNAAVSPPIPPPNPLLAATDYGTCCGYQPGTACDCPDDGPLDALVERQEQRRRDESLRAAKVAATHLLDGCPCPRPCCHTTGPNHHPACQEAK
jgi:hypothetical protein